MKTFLGILLSTIVLLIFTGCKEDSTTEPQLHNFPVVAKNWEGIVSITGMLEESIIIATFTQTQDSILNGAIVQYLGTLVVSDSVVGIIKNTNQISLATIDYTVIEGTITSWYLTTWNATLNARGDSISGTWLDTGGYSGAFRLVKK